MERALPQGGRCSRAGSGRAEIMSEWREKVGLSGGRENPAAPGPVDVMFSRQWFLTHYGSVLAPRDLVATKDTCLERNA